MFGKACAILCQLVSWSRKKSLDIPYRQAFVYYALLPPPEIFYVPRALISSFLQSLTNLITKSASSSAPR